jgi:hypothetical protein
MLTINADANCTILIDHAVAGEFRAGEIRGVTAGLGQHYLEAVTPENRYAKVVVLSGGAAEVQIKLSKVRQYRLNTQEIDTLRRQYEVEDTAARKGGATATGGASGPAGGVNAAVNGRRDRNARAHRDEAGRLRVKIGELERENVVIRSEL